MGISDSGVFGGTVALRARHYSRRTEEAYVYWIGRFIRLHERWHTRQLTKADVDRFLPHRLVEEHGAAAPQNQALCAILILREGVLEHPLDRIEGVVRARRPKRLPLVLTVVEAAQVIGHLQSDKWLIAMLLCSGGLRLLEALRLRVKDLDPERGEISVREREGDKDRLTMLPKAVIRPLRKHKGCVRAIHQHDLADGYGRVELPHALARKYPNTNWDWSWH